MMSSERRREIEALMRRVNAVLDDYQRGKPVDAGLASNTIAELRGAVVSLTEDIGDATTHADLEAEIVRLRSLVPSPGEEKGRALVMIDTLLEGLTVVMLAKISCGIPCARHSDYEHREVVRALLISAYESSSGASLVPWSPEPDKKPALPTRQIVYDWLKLPHHVRLNIAADLGLTDVDDPALPDVELSRRIMERANASGKVQALGQAVQAAAGVPRSETTSDARSHTCSDGRKKAWHALECSTCRGVSAPPPLEREQVARVTIVSARLIAHEMARGDTGRDRFEEYLQWVRIVHDAELRVSGAPVGDFDKTLIEVLRKHQYAGSRAANSIEQSVALCDCGAEMVGAITYEAARWREHVADAVLSLLRAGQQEPTPTDEEKA